MLQGDWGPRVVVQIHSTLTNMQFLYPIIHAFKVDMKGPEFQMMTLLKDEVPSH